MARSVAANPAGIDFGPVRPGTIGPDITVDPSLPGTAVSFNGGVRLTAPAEGQVTAQITTGTEHFHVRDVLLLDWVLESVDPTELPPGHRGRLPRIRVLEVIGRSDGVTPLTVSPGQTVLARVEYFALSTEGTFTGTLNIQSDGWEPVDVPLSLFLAEVSTALAPETVNIPRGGSATIAIAIHSLAGPDVDVSYEMSGLQLDTGLTLSPATFHLPAHQDLAATLTFHAAPDAPLGPNEIGLAQLAFGRHGFLVNVDIVPAPPIPPVPPPVAGRFCDFFDPPGSPTLGPRSYGLKNGLGRKANLTWSLAPTSALNGVPSDAVAVPPAPSMGSELAAAFGLWSAATGNLLTFQRVGGGADITIVAANLGGVSKAGNLTLGQTTADGSRIMFNNNPAAVFVPQAPGPTSFLAVAIHEIGHAIGLLHDTTTNSVMFPNQQPVPVETLSVDDVAAVRALYAWAPQTPVLDVGTESSPALCGCGSVLLALAWRGVGDDHDIRVATSADGVTWTPFGSHGGLVPGAATSDSPALMFDGERLWMAWKGIPDDHGLWYATWDLVGDWTPVQAIEGAGSEFAPSLSSTPSNPSGPVPTLVWRGIGDDQAIYWTNFTDGRWQGQRRIDNVGTSDRPSITTGTTAFLPLIVWKGVDHDFGLYTSTMLGQQWQPQVPISSIVLGNGGTGNVTTDRPGSTFGPSITSVAGRTALAWRGTADDQDLWFTQSFRDIPVSGAASPEWSSQSHIGRFDASRYATASRPSITVFAASTYIAWRGAGDDHRIYTTFM